jgi:hypothetical protein
MIKNVHFYSINMLLFYLSILLNDKYLHIKDDYKC